MSRSAHCFSAASFPALVMTAFMMGYVYYCARRYGMGRDQAFRWRTLGVTFIAAFPALLTPAIIVGGMTFGWFTPTEAAIAACAWAMVLGIFLYRTLTPKQFYKVSMETIETTAGVLLIVGAASLFGWVLTTTRVTEYTTEALLALTDNRYIILLADQHPAAGGRLLPRADRVDQHSGAGADAGHCEGWHRPGAFRRDDDAQPDDRTAASAARHGALRVVPGCQAVDRADDNGDSALADTPAIVADSNHDDPRIDPVAAAELSG